mmetsp:Transcript_18173/g.51267  ORF Transcript_18173/g.51267 Transcript_18173/m.51267 type:complete len:382 (+) Transcript_18173:62-1207(+)
MRIEKRILLGAALGFVQHGGKCRDEVLVLLEVVQVRVDPEPPVVLGDGGVVDRLLVRGPGVPLRGEPQEVLHGEDGPAAGRLQVLLDDALHDLGRAVLRGRPGALQLLHPEAPSAARVLGPPGARGSRVVAGGRGDAEVGVRGRVAEFARILRAGHALDAEAQDAQVPQHAGHARWNHAEVFPADEHVGGVQQGRQGLLGVGPPEALLAAVEVVMVQAPEHPLRVGVQLLEGPRLQPPVAGVEPLVVSRVPHQHHVLMQLQQLGLGVFHLLDQPVRGAFARLHGGHGLFRGVLRSEPEAARLELSEVLAGHLCRRRPEHLLQSVCADVRVAQAVEVPDALGFELPPPQGHRGPEAPEHARDSALPDLPDAEKAQDVVDPER